LPAGCPRYFLGVADLLMMVVVVFPLFFFKLCYVIDEATFKLCSGIVKQNSDTKLGHGLGRHSWHLSCCYPPSNQADPELQKFVMPGWYKSL